ncbi:MAG: hypothetical protein KAS13_06320, partial [Candidatus Omnitrophica bacterium]|nr:hypothetical protein [Candidatus Omnitrophota bacterium]
MKKTIKDHYKRSWRTRLRRLAAGLFVLLGLSILLFSLSSNIQAAQIKKVQNTTTTSNSSVTISLTDIAEAVDTSNTFILQYVEMGEVYTYEQKKGGKGGESFGLFTTTFEAPTMLNVSRLRADDISYDMSANVQNTLLEFTDGVSIMSGTATIGATVDERYITLPDTIIDLTKGFPVLMVKSGFLSKQAESEHWTFMGTFYDSNTLKLERLKRPTVDNYYPAPTVIVQWQVIQFESDVVVTSGTVTLPAGEALVPDTLTTPISNINKAFLVFSYMGAFEIEGVKQDLLT